MKNSVKENEGFESKPYIDPLVKRNPLQHGIPIEDMATIKKHLDKLTLTFGYGFTFITKEEADAVVEIRLSNIRNELFQRISFFKDLHAVAQDILVEMAYQIGVNGLLKFKKTLEYLEDENYKAAAVEMLDSSWAKNQTPQRALKLSELMSKL